MKIESIDIKNYFYTSFSMDTNDGIVHRKALPYLSIVQSKIGSYGIQIDDGKEFETGEGNFFIAPSVSTQKITHHLNKEKSLFCSRYIFLDIIINKKYRFDDVFDLPVIPSISFDTAFDKYEQADNICDKMKCIYDIIKLLISVSTPKDIHRNSCLYPLINFMKTNYQRNISVSDMASVLNMSESNLYSVFKKSTGMSPLKYLNEYRLSVAAAYLLQTDDTIKEIAEKVGIDDPFYFSKLFKSKYHMPPQKYRKEQY